MSNRKFNMVELFAGCGGLSEGFLRAGFDVIAQVEMDYWSCETLRTRLMYHLLKEDGLSFLYNRYLRSEISREDIFAKNKGLGISINSRVIQKEIGETQLNSIMGDIKFSLRFHRAAKVDVLVGGPPCQPYSIAGRSRDNHKMHNDERHYLYKYYLKILEYLQPDLFVYENVPGIFTAKANGTGIFSRIIDDFSSLHPPYVLTPPLDKISVNLYNYILDTADFNIPQSRKRFILIGYKKSLENRDPEISRMFSKLQKKALLNRKKQKLTVSDAIADLPSLKPGEGSDGWLCSYNGDAGLCKYQVIMRKDSQGILNHKARTHMPSDLERYRFFIEHCKDGNGAATLKDLSEKRPDLMPNHKNLDKFLDRFKVQWWNRSSSTIMAHICKDGHYYIHPDIDQCRSFTVREAARCQSFPDNYKFEGPRTHQLRQVGNAVPPLLSHSIARILMKELKKIYG